MQHFSYMDGLGYLVSGSKGQLLHGAALQLKMVGLGYLVSVIKDNCYMNAAFQLYIAGLGHFVMVNKGQLLHECIISVVHDRSESSCNGK